MITVAVIGPHDLVERTVEVVGGMDGMRPRPHPYEHERETPQVLRELGSDVDIQLFTGVVPYQIASAHGLLGRIAGYVEYSGSVLLSALVTVLRAGTQLTSLSIDTLDEDEARGTLAEAGVQADAVRVLPYAPGTDAATLVAFHRRAHADDPGSIALTCLGSVYDEIGETQPAVRLAPARSAIRLAVNRLRLQRESMDSGDAQLVLGIVEAAADAEHALAGELAPLGASLIHTGSREFLVVTTRGPLEDATAEFTELPMLERLRAQYPTLRVGFGLGGSGAEAHTLARRALGRARQLGRVAAVISLRNDIDMTLSRTSTPRSNQRANTGQLAHRAGLSVGTLQRLQDYLRHATSPEVTTRELSEHLGVQPRTARRILNRLERAGIARDVGSRNPEGSGRPLVVYRVYL
ncbi:winged helix-turn-helix transcriptional regulator [Occultella glacieicola]|uniref:Winged helix-turn-helix transcriptional regulator n=1 Tax=Occultella glacieicola TaxID=2518684 RepID=A0ABY2E665_9MICO|nr:winged helix-turn-helix transcriptional regulator [Occultella glacieicola]TDE92782.1 winged helix-turn-helix transcriptional regulator [Occultella glacieicola]